MNQPGRQDAPAKDAFVPIVLELMERYLANVTDKNEFDRGFDNVFARDPHTTRRMEKILQTYRAIPEQKRRQLFFEPTAGRSARAPVTKDEVIQALRFTFPGLVDYVVGPVLQKIEPAPPEGGGYAAGDDLTLVGNFATEPTENEIWLWMSSAGPDGGALKARGWAYSTSATQLRFRLPDPISPGLWAIYVKTPKGKTKDLPLPVRAPAMPPKPVIKDVTPLINAEPGMTINIRTEGSGMRKNPRVLMTASSPVQIAGDFIWTTGKTKSDTECEVELPKDMTAGTYDIQVEGGTGAWTPGASSSWSDGYKYIVQPGRYRIIFKSMECVQPIHDMWDRDADLVTLWSAVSDGGAWAKASSKYEDIGGGHPPVPYKADGVVFTNVPENFQGYMDVRYGLALVTELYDWGGDDPGTELAQDVKMIGQGVGAVVTIAFPAAGAVIGKVAEIVANLIPLIAAGFGYGGNTPLHWGGPDQQTWTAAKLQEMAPGDSSSLTTMKFGYGQMVERWGSLDEGQPPTYNLFVDGGNRIGDWKLTWTIERSPAR